MNLNFQILILDDFKQQNVQTFKHTKHKTIMLKRFEY